jgi:hypothetical protein
MKTILAAFSAVALSACYGNIYLGANSGKDAAGTVNTIALGENAAYGIANGDGVVAIGNGAAAGSANLKRVVAIGSGELAGVDGLEDAVSINSQQLFISRQLNAFALNPLMEDYIGKSPLWYLDGSLYLNAAKVYGIPITHRSIEGYDFYISEGGNDDNDGKTPQTAKRTLMGLYSSNTNATGRVCVFAGDYAPISNERATGATLDLFNPNGNAFTFVAVEGKERTTITGVYENPDGFDDGRYHTLAFTSGPQIFEGFTFRNISGWRKYSDRTGAAGGSAPMASCCYFRDCAFVSERVYFGYRYSCFNSCFFENCTIDIAEAYFMQSGGSVSGTFAIGCEMYNTRVVIPKIDSLAGNTASEPFRFADECYFEKSLFDLSPVVNNNLEGMEKSSQKSDYDSCTFIYGIACDGNGVTRFAPSRATNCYFCVGQNWESYTNIYPERGNVCAASWTNTFLTAEYIAASVDCPAVRGDGRDDAGWKSSGLAFRKTASVRADIRLESGELVVYSDGVPVGRIPFEAYPAATTLALPRTASEPTETTEPRKTRTFSTIVVSE